jgi:DNA-binding response OmpR family regulator
MADGPAAAGVQGGRPGDGDAVAQPTQILIADDDPDLRCSLAAQLRGDGYAVATAGDGRTALQAAEQQLPHLAIVDLLVPAREGFALAESLRRLGNVAVILLSRLDDEEIRVRGLEEYAQDYVTKPFSYRELRARIRRVLAPIRSADEARGSPLTLEGGVEVDLARRRVLRPGRDPVRLTPTEARLLGLLAERRGEVLPRNLLLERGWPAGGGTTQSLWEYVRRLRRKLGDDPRAPAHLWSERGLGYRLRAPRTPPAPSAGGLLPSPP